MSQLMQRRPPRRQRFCGVRDLARRQCGKPPIKRLLAPDTSPICGGSLVALEAELDRINRINRIDDGTKREKNPA